MMKFFKLNKPYITEKPIYFVTILYVSGETQSTFYTDNKEKCEGYKEHVEEILRGNEEKVLDIVIEERVLTCYGEEDEKTGN